jgi:hypothetical protein
MGTKSAAGDQIGSDARGLGPGRGHHRHGINPNEVGVRAARWLLGASSTPPPPSVTAVRALPDRPAGDVCATDRGAKCGPIAQVIALAAPVALELSNTPFHETFHANGRL